MSKQIKEEIQKFKEKNGNDTFTTKDLLMYLVQRVDNLPCEDHLGLVFQNQGEIVSIQRMIKHWRWFAGIILTFLVAFLGWCHFG